MRINGQGLGVALGLYFRNGARVAEPGKGKNGPAAEDSVCISAEARELAASDTAAERAGTVARLKQMVESGQYEVAPEKVADAIIRHAAKQ